LQAWVIIDDEHFFLIRDKEHGGYLIMHVNSWNRLPDYVSNDHANEFL